MGNYASDQKTSRFFGLKLNRNTDAELIQQLESQQNIQEYLKRLIRNDMKGENTMKTYKIKPEYLDLWEGGDTPSDPDRIITEDELNELSAEWEKPIEELLQQLEEI